MSHLCADALIFFHSNCSASVVPSFCTIPFKQTYNFLPFPPISYHWKFHQKDKTREGPGVWYPRNCFLHGNKEGWKGAEVTATSAGQHTPHRHQLSGAKIFLNSWLTGRGISKAAQTCSPPAKSDNGNTANVKLRFKLKGNKEIYADFWQFKGNMMIWGLRDTESHKNRRKSYHQPRKTRMLSKNFKQGAICIFLL